MTDHKGNPKDAATHSTVPGHPSEKETEPNASSGKGVPKTHDVDTDTPKVDRDRDDN